jgi:membrane fusion protein, multidrug efflux system
LHGNRKIGIRFYSATALSLLFLAVFSLTACENKAEKTPPVIPVTTTSVIQKDVPVQLMAIGTAESYHSITIRAEIGGQILRVNFKEGQDVKKGDLLIVIDPRLTESALQQAEAALAKDRVQAEKAELDAKRYADLVKKGYVSQDQYEQFQTAAEAIKAVIKADKSAVENYRVQLQYCYIRSPISGRTGSLLVHEGNLVKANDIALLTINQIAPINVTFTVPEQYLGDIKKYQALGNLKVEAVIPGKEHPETGTLYFMDNTVDPSTGTIRLKGTFSNSEKRLWPGQFVNIAMTLTTQKGATLIPTQAIQRGQQGTFVFVVKSDRTVETRAVVVNRSLDGETVIDKGLSPGETVVTDGQIRLVPGSSVEIKAEG